MPNRDAMRIERVEHDRLRRTEDTIAERAAPDPVVQDLERAVVTAPPG
jgi:hypothetical protein